MYQLVCNMYRYVCVHMTCMYVDRPLSLTLCCAMNIQCIDLCQMHAQTLSIAPSVPVAAGPFSFSTNSSSFPTSSFFASSSSP